MENVEFENRTYVNPDLSRDEQMQFIDTLRGMQDRNAQEIGRETHALGTDVTSNLGGLGGAEETWNARFQEPQMNAVAAQLKTAAQQTALNNALSNYSNMLQNRYNQAYRDYQKRAYNYSRSNTGGGTNPTGGGSVEGETVFRDQEEYTGGESELTLPTDTSSGFNQSYTGSVSQISGGGQPYSTSGTGYYYEDAAGNRTAFRAHTSGNSITGIDTGTASYTGQGGINMLNRVVSGGGRIYNSSGTDITDLWQWVMTH